MLAPLRGAMSLTSGDRGCRFAQPPANRWHPCRGADLSAAYPCFTRVPSVAEFV